MTSRTVRSAGAAAAPAPPRPRRPRVTVDQLFTFAAVAEQASLTRAAAVLHRSPAALSEQLRGLEQSLGVPLFHRSARGLRLTEAGRALAWSAASALDRIGAFEAEAAAMHRAERGEVVLIAGSVIGTHRLPKWVASLLAREDGLDLRVLTAGRDEAIRRLREHGADVAVIGDQITAGDLETSVVERTELIVVVSRRHPLALRRHAPAALNDHRFLCRSTDSATEALSRRLLGDAYRAGPLLELSEGALTRALHDGVGWACMPRSAVATALDDGRLVEVRTASEPVLQEITAVRRREPATPAAERVWQHLVGG
jgi:DNA-binding transcriptional LysR family regulator